MRKFWIVAALLVALPSTAAAQAVMPGDGAAARALQWRDHEKAADWISTGLVAGALAAPCVSTEDRPRCWKREAWRVGLSLAFAEVTKRAVGRDRPDQSDRKSFYSMHTALAITAATSAKHRPAIFMAIGAGILRMVAHKHWLSDVLVGAVAGLSVGMIR